MNPPYGRQIEPWIVTAYTEAVKGNLTAALLPARTDTRWFHTYIYGQHEVRFIKGRVKFSGSKNSAPFPSMIVIFKH
jgi:site-specific DNA-methyltransferase (adenine-specific)